MVPDQSYNLKFNSRLQMHLILKYFFKKHIFIPCSFDTIIVHCSWPSFKSESECSRYKSGATFEKHVTLLESIFSKKIIFRNIFQRQTFRLGSSFYALMKAPKKFLPSQFFFSYFNKPKSASKRWSFYHKYRLSEG